MTVDAVIVGSGPNGLVAANILADAGWSVQVIEEQNEPGGAVRTASGATEGYTADLCSSFYPLAAASRAIAALDLPRYGLRWVHAPQVMAHPLPDGRAAVLHRDLERTAEGLDALGTHDGAAWKRLYGLWHRIGVHLLDSLFTPFPPVRSGIRLARELRIPGLLRTARFATLPVRRLAEEEFTGLGGPLLLSGSALHTDLMPESAGSGVYGWLLSMLGQQYGFPVPQGGAGELTAALVRRLDNLGGEVHCGSGAREIIVRSGRAVAVRTAAGDEIAAKHAVLADVPATVLYGGLVAWEHLPPRLRDDLRRFHWDYGTFKVDWALSRPVPWTNPEVANAGTVHIADGMNAMSEYTSQLSMGRIPAHPFVLLGQMTTCDPSRSPIGTESLWGYTHVPRRVAGDAGGKLLGLWDDTERQCFADRLEDEIQRFAPGFRDRIIARRINSPMQLAQHNASLVGGAINGGTTALHQQLIFRPTPGLGRPETPIAGLYLSSASAHPGGGVHGACGSNAARAALRQARTRTQSLAAAVDRWTIGE